MRSYIYILCLLGLNLSCTTPKSPEPEIDTYPPEIAALLSAKGCTGCHDAQNRAGDLQLESWAALFAGSAHHGSVCIPYSTDWSSLLWHVNRFGGTSVNPLMPLSSSNPPTTDSTRLLNLAEYNILKNWIAEGAPSQRGTHYWQAQTQTNQDKLFFLAAGADQLGVIDPKTKLVSRYQPVGEVPQTIEAPHYIQRAPDGSAVFLTLLQGGYVEKYSAADYKRLARSPFLGDQPAHVEISADGRWALVSHWVSGSGKANLSLLNAQTLELVDQIRGADLHQLHGIAWRKDGKFAYVTANGGNYIIAVEIDPVNGKFVQIANKYSLRMNRPPEASTTVCPYHIVLNPAEDRLYVSVQAANYIMVLAVTDARFTPLMDMGLSMETTCRKGVGKSPRLLKYYENKLYVACSEESCLTSPNGPLLGCISVFQVGDDNFNWIKNIYGVGHKPHGIDIDRKRRELWIFAENQGGVEHHPIPGATYQQGTYAVVNIDNLKPVLAHPRDIAFFPNGCVFNE